MSIVCLVIFLLFGGQLIHSAALLRFGCVISSCYTQSSYKASFLREFDRTISREALAGVNLSDIVQVFNARFDLKKE